MSVQTRGEDMHSLCPEVHCSQRVEGNPILLGPLRANAYEIHHIANTRHVHCETIFICMPHLTFDVLGEEGEPAELPDKQSSIPTH